MPILPHDSIAVRQPTLQDVTEGVRAIEERRSEANDEIILFDLTDNNIKRFKQEEYEKIFNRSHHFGMQPQSISARSLHLLNIKHWQLSTALRKNIRRR